MPTLEEMNISYVDITRDDEIVEKVLKYKKSVMLEPMNPYERRIIHSEIQNIEGVSTNSIGSENNRKIVIFLDGDN